EIFKEPNPRVSDCHVAEATLYLKGVTLRARDASPEMLHSLNLMVDELARQVKRHRDKLRHRREAHAAAGRQAARGRGEGRRPKASLAAPVRGYCRPRVRVRVLLGVMGALAFGSTLAAIAD